MFVVIYRKFFYILSAVLIVVSIGAYAKWDLNYGIDFKGGTLVEIDYPKASFPHGRIAQDVLVSNIAPLKLDATVRPVGDTGYMIRARSIEQSERVSLEGILSVGTTTTMNLTTGATTTTAGVVEKQFDSIGPVLGDEAKRKAEFSIVLVLVAIVLFIAYAFRQVSKPISSWKYGIIAIIALMHDIFIPTGAFAILGHYAGYEVDTLFVTALLVVLGFSVHNTIVVFDRVRENLRHASAKKPFEEIVGDSISQTFTRSINTSLTTLLALVVLYFVGGETTAHFSLALIIGIAAGTYSSVFIGSPLLVTLEKWQAKRARK
jgi:preprotein translocase subunit SecF